MRQNGDPPEFLIRGLKLLIVPHEKKLQPVDYREELLVEDTSPFRRNQFRYGRWAARLALKELGVVYEGPILRSELGAPIPPTGVSLSISHGSQLSAAAACLISDGIKVGIDLETDDANFAFDEWDLITTEKERNGLSQRLGIAVDEAVNLAFSAKEAVYKVVSERSECGELDFRDVILRSYGASKMEAVIRPEFGIANGKVTVFWARGAEHMITLARLDCV